MKNAPRKQRLVVALLVLLHGVVLLGGFVAPYDPIRQNRERPYAPPAGIHLVDGQLREGSFFADSLWRTDFASCRIACGFCFAACRNNCGERFGVPGRLDGFDRYAIGGVVSGFTVAVFVVRDAGFFAAASESGEGVFDRCDDDWRAGMGEAGATCAGSGSEREGAGFRAG